MKGTAAICVSGALALGAQEPIYFQETARPWWRPQGELRLEADRLPPLDEGDGGTILRVRSLVQLDWSKPWRSWSGDLALRAGVGSDGNQLNLPRYDQRPSNGVWLQRASITYQRQGEGGSGFLTAGLQGNPLLSQESLWDHDLAIFGVGVGLAARDEGRGLLEAGLRGIAGRVRTFPGGNVDLAAAQGVLRMETGPVQWTFHAGRWDLRWDRGVHRFEAPDRRSGNARVHVRLDAAGFALAGGSVWPWEVKAAVQRNTATGETGGEGQLWLGPLVRHYWPRLGLIQQRFAARVVVHPLGPRAPRGRDGAVSGPGAHRP